MKRPRRSPPSPGLLGRLFRAVGAARTSSASRGRARAAAPRPAASPILWLVVLGVALVAGLLTYEISYADRIYQGVRSQGVSLGGLTRAEARAALAQGARRFAQTPIALKGETGAGQAKEWRALPDEMGVAVEILDAVNAAWSVGRIGGVDRRLGEQLSALLGGAGIGDAYVVVDAEKRSAFLAAVARDVDRSATDARLAVKPADPPVVEIQKGKPGRRLNAEATGRAIDAAVTRAVAWADATPAAKAGATPGPISVEIVVDESLPPTIGEPALVAAVEKARKLVSSPLVARYEGRNWTISPREIAEALVPSGSPSGTDVTLDEEKLKNPLELMARESEAKPKNGRFDYAGGAFSVISPGQPGRRIDVAAAAPAVKAAILDGAKTVDLPGTQVEPEFGADDAGKLQALGLTRIEEASTDYDVGSNDRRFNVELATSRAHGVLLMPGEVFSFNEAVGEVSYRNGYKQGYGISRNAEGDVITIPSEGGGICQVATTLFHSVFHAGLPIVERHWHSYWIPRYGLPPKGMKGLDATVDQIYDKSGKLIAAIDLRFKNSTDAPLLVVARTDKKNVTFQLIGKKPGWTVKASEPKISEVVKADTTVVRQLDASLAPGAETKIEEARDGFLAAIVRTVTGADGKVIEQKTFVAKYNPSRNVILHGPKPSPSPTPARPTATPKPIATPKPSAAPKPGATPKPAAP